MVHIYSPGAINVTIDPLFGIKLNPTPLLVMAFYIRMSQKIRGNI